jgi:hypothetical protein
MDSIAGLVDGWPRGNPLEADEMWMGMLASTSPRFINLKICSPVAAKNPPYRAMPGHQSQVSVPTCFIHSSYGNTGSGFCVTGTHAIEWAPDKCCRAVILSDL